MKKLLCLVFTVLLVINMGAQQMRNARPAKLNHDAPLSVKKTAVAPAQEMKMATPEDRARFRESPKTRTVRPFYKRPAGAFHSAFVAVDGAGLYSYGDFQFLLTKPFADYTFAGTTVGGSDEGHDFSWKYWINAEEYALSGSRDLTYSLASAKMDSVPILYLDGNQSNKYQMVCHRMQMNDDTLAILSRRPIQLLSITNSAAFDEDTEFLLSSKTLCGGGRYGDQINLMTTYTGAQPYGNNERGWWFGKNGQHIDGIAQCFEKPSHPYLLKAVYLQTYPNFLNVTGNVEMKCTVYRLNSIPAYEEDTTVVLPQVPGEVIAYGKATVDRNTADEKNGLIQFTLYNYDEMWPDDWYELTPTIDYPIMICIDGYNDANMSNLADFSAFVSTDDHVDEGYGELAYLKTPVNDDEGNFTGEYVWTGLNNYFSSGEMKTGLSIFISIENNYLYMNHPYEVEYVFPAEGGAMHQEVEQSGETIVTDGIEFLTTAYAEDFWPTCNGDEAPSWLNFEFEDLGNNESGKLVLARVTAEQMPAGLPHREAVVRFEIPGDYIDFTFIQNASGDFFLENGIYYMRLNTNQVSVVNYDYRGDLVIPASVIHDGVSYNVVAISENAFMNCSGLSSLAIPVSVTSIGANAFAGCNVQSISISGFGQWMAGALPSRVNTLYIGSGVTSVAGMNVNPTSVYSYSTTPPVCDGQSFYGYDGTLTVPKSAVSSYFMADYWCNFANISGSAVEPLGISLNQDSLNMVVGDMFSLEASIFPQRATPNQASWYSSNTNVATVMNGLVRAVGKGECDIYATCVNKQVVCHVKVVEQLVTITLDQDVIAIMPNEIAVLTPSAVPELPEITVSSSDQSVAAARYIKGQVQVVGVNAGTATITVSATDDTALPATCQVYVFSQCGDVDCDGEVAISDVTVLIDYLLGNGGTILPAMGDLDDDGVVGISDVSTLIDILLYGTD